MTYRGPGFVDYHCHLLRSCASTGAPWGTRDEIRTFHARCAQLGVSPVDELEGPAEPGLDDALAEGLRRAASLGLVEIWEAGARSWDYLDALSRLREQGPLPVRVRLLAAAGLADSGMRARTGDAYVDVVGIKFYADGWLGPRTCATESAFVDEPDNRGLLFQSSEVLARRVEPYARKEWAVATHAIGDRAIEAVLDAYDLVYGSDCAAARPRIEHVQLLRTDLIERMAAMGVVACIQPCFAVDDAADAARALGTQWPVAYRWSELRSAGVRIRSGSDYPIAGLEPLVGLSKLLASPFDEVSVGEALTWMTDERAGSVLLSADPREVDAENIADIEVLEAIPSG